MWVFFVAPSHSRAAMLCQNHLKQWFQKKATKPLSQLQLSRIEYIRMEINQSQLRQCYQNENWKVLHGSPVHFHVTMALQLQIMTPSNLL
jgi:hypothetical protein